MTEPFVVNAAGRRVPTEVNGRSQTPYQGVGGFEPEGFRHAPRIRSARDYPKRGDKRVGSLRDVAGGLLLISQFTLAADTEKGLRPGFSTALAPVEAEPLFAELFAVLDAPATEGR